MPSVNASVIEDLAAGRVGLDAAARSLQQSAAQGGISFEAVAHEVSADAVKYGLEPALAEKLLVALSNAMWKTSPSAESDGAGNGAATQVRTAAADRGDAALTTLRPAVTSPSAPTSLRAAVSPALRENNAGSMTRLRTGDARGVQCELTVGSLIKGRFELKTLVGRGGMGMVYSAMDRRKVEARDPSPEVAVKILSSAFQQHPDAFVALQREASKAQTLAHPNIVTVFDFDRDGDSVFITMQLLRGQSLEEAISAVRNRGLERPDALPIIRGIAEGLAYAHRKGIVHSDLKPANIFLLEDGTPKILDFGIARAVPTAGNSGPQDQFDAGTLGAYTEGYATEEMVQGVDPAPADDIYALGIIVYELLTGRHPFAGNAAAAARSKGMVAAPIRSLRRREWQTLARALDFDRARRPRDATEFLRLFFGATRLRNLLIVAIVLLAVASGYLWYRNYQQAGPAVPFEQLPAATQQQINTDFAEGNKAWAFYAQQGVVNALSDSISYFADAYKLHKGDREAARGLARAADEMLHRSRGDPAVQRETARTLADTSEFLKTYPPVVDALGL